MKQEKNKQPKQQSPLAMFFKLGEKVTGGDPEKKMDFDYYFMWIIFLAFCTIFVSQLYNFIMTFDFFSLGWSFFALAIMWFQYNNLKNFYRVRKQQKGIEVEESEKNKIEDVNEMLESFEE